MRDFFIEFATSLPYDYSDIRYEENKTTQILYSGKELKKISENYTSGGHIRIFNNGGKAFGSFTNKKQLPILSTELAQIAASKAKENTKPVRLAPAPIIKAEIILKPAIHPLKISLQEKKELLEEYNNIALNVPGITTTDMYYYEFYSKRIFANSEGTLIEYELLIVNIGGAIIAVKDNLTQSMRVGIGGNDNYGKLLNRCDIFQQKAQKAVELLSAEPAQGGTYSVILDPSEAGVFIHEAFGHLSEADIIQNHPTFRNKLKLGTEIANPVLNVSDDPNIMNAPGGYIFDDEGVVGSKTKLITDGILTGRMHSRETAADYEEPITGNMRAVDYKFTPIIRMSNIFIENGKSSFDEMVSSIDNGYYLVGAKGGQTSGDRFTFGAEYGYKIEKGKITALVRDINMSGELFSTLQNVKMVGNDLSFGETGGCGKGGAGGSMQLNRKSGKGSPHILIENVTIGGKQ